MSWEIVEKPIAKDRSKPPRMYASLNKRGEIAINDNAFEAINRPENVTVMFDAAERTIGVKFPVTGDRHYFRAGYYGRNDCMRIVRAARLLKKFGIEIERTVVFDRIEVESFRNVPMLVLDLAKTSPLPDKKRKV